MVNRLSTQPKSTPVSTPRTAPAGPASPSPGLPAHLRVLTAKGPLPPGVTRALQQRGTSAGRRADAPGAAREKLAAYLGQPGHQPLGVNGTLLA